MRNFLFILIMVIATTATAGFDPAIWPMYEHPSQTDAIESNVVDQVVKRQLSISTASNQLAAISWWRSRSGNLQTIKNKVQTLLQSGKWVQIFEIGGDVLGCVLASNTVPVYSSGNLSEALARWGLPTNYFAYTPWSNLSGIGGLTNDLAAVGHPHGFTNSTTVKGGTSYPGSRTCWYTTDYGWDGLRIILTNMTAITVNYWQNYLNYSPHWGYCWAGQFGNPSGYADAIAIAETTNWMNSSDWYFQGIGQGTHVAVAFTNTIFDLITVSHSGFTTVMPSLPVSVTSWVSRCDYYFGITNIGISSSLFELFDGQSYGWTTNVIEVPATILTNGAMYYAFSETNPPPNWPTFPETNTTVTVGWSTLGNIWAPNVTRFTY